jgi:hypothetical protein
MNFSTWFKAPTKDEDDSKVHNPLIHTPRMKVLNSIREGPLKPMK